MVSTSDDDSTKPSRISEELMAHTYRKFIDSHPEKFNRNDIGAAIVRYLKREELSKNENFEVSSKVMERLLLRHAILKNMESIESQYDASRTYVPRKKRIAIWSVKCGDTAPAQGFFSNSAPAASVGPSDPKPESMTADEKNTAPCFVNEFEYDDKSERSNRTYRLAATDLFVEKAIAYLERDSVDYIKRGNWLFGAALLSIAAGGVASAVTFVYDMQKGTNNKGFSIYILDNTLFSFKIGTWMDFTSSFVKAFTF